MLCGNLMYVFHSDHVFRTGAKEKHPQPNVADWPASQQHHHHSYWHDSSLCTSDLSEYQNCKFVSLQCLSYYWLCSGLFSLIQNLWMMTPSARRILRLPTLGNESETPFRDLWQNAKTRYSWRKNKSLE